jgi:hypothetical protein
MSSLLSPPGSSRTGGAYREPELVRRDEHEGSHDTITIDDVFTHHIGELGLHQVWLFCIVSLSWLPGSLVTLNMAFFGAPPAAIYARV